MTPETGIKLDDIILDPKIKTKAQIFHMAADTMAGRSGAAARSFYQTLIRHDQQGSVAVGDGLAIPHIITDLLSEPYTLFMRVPHIDFESPDGQPVDLLCLLASPDNDARHHLRRLAKISRLLKDKRLCAMLRGADHEDAIHALFYDPLSWADAA